MAERKRAGACCWPEMRPSHQRLSGMSAGTKDEGKEAQRREKEWENGRNFCQNRPPQLG